MNTFPDCVPQEQYKPDEVVKNDYLDDFCPECGLPELREIREYDDDGFFSSVIKCDNCHYEE